MKKLLFTALITATFAAPLEVRAQAANSQLTNLLTQLGTAYANSHANAATSSEMTISQFNSLKSQILQQTKTRISQLQQEQRCGQQATTPEALNGCYAADTPISTGATATTTTGTNQYMTQGSNLLQQYGSQYLHR